MVTIKEISRLLPQSISGYLRESDNFTFYSQQAFNIINEITGLELDIEGTRVAELNWIAVPTAHIIYWLIAPSVSLSDEEDKRVVANYDKAVKFLENQKRSKRDIKDTSGSKYEKFGEIEEDYNVFE